MSSAWKPRPFTAWQECPACNECDNHHLTAPPPVDPDPELPAGAAEYGHTTEEQILSYEIPHPVRTITSRRTRYRADLSTCTALRICTNCRATFPTH